MEQQKAVALEMIAPYSNSGCFCNTLDLYEWGDFCGEKEGMTDVAHKVDFSLHGASWNWVQKLPPDARRLGLVDPALHGAFWN